MHAASLRRCAVLRARCNAVAPAHTSSPAAVDAGVLCPPHDAPTQLLRLRVKNWALIESLSLDFGSGLTCLTGNSGSGKSLLVEALSQLAGAPLPGEVVRAPAKTATLEAAFHIGPAQRLAVAAALDGTGCAWRGAGGDGVLLLRRDITSSGPTVSGASTGGDARAPPPAAAQSSSCRVNGAAVALKVLKRVGSLLLDINGQGAAACVESRLLEVLDALGGTTEAAAEFERVLGGARSDARAARDARAAAAPLPGAAAAALASLVADVERAGPARGETGALKRAVRAAEARAAASRSLAEAAQRLDAAYAEAAAGLRAARAARLPQPPAGEGGGDDGGAGAAALAAEAARDAAVAAVDALRAACADCAAAAEAAAPDAVAADAAAVRLRALDRLCRRHGVADADALLDSAAEAASRLAAAEGDGPGGRGTARAAAAAAASRVASARSRLGELGAALSASRRAAAAELERSTGETLASLGFDAGAALRVAIRWVEQPGGDSDEDDDGDDDSNEDADADGARLPSLSLSLLVGPVPGVAYAPQRAGLDVASLLFAPAAREPLRPLGAVASCGERARVALALRSLPLPPGAAPPIVVLDEPDAGLGGGAGAAVGRALRQLAVSRQAVTVTHLPQAAAFAHALVAVSKTANAGSHGEERVVSTARVVEGRADRAAVLGAMLGLGPAEGEALLRAAECRANLASEKEV